MNERKPIKKLETEVARKIAAGEVIDRPNAIIRELMDNALDSGANTINVELEEGGIKKIRVVDNGHGMSKEDLQNCAYPHATSKISSEKDLLNLTTLGFRGEALSSIAAVSRLTIISASWKMCARVNDTHILTPHAPINGTIVQSEGLFENFPARRKFLKRDSAEAKLCKTTFIEKTLCRPDVAFTLDINGKRTLTLEKTSSLRHRFVQSTQPLENESLFYETKHETHSDFSFSLIIGEPSIFRPTKKDIYIFVNGRRITEYSLVQAIEYGSTGYFPNGTYPVAALFVNIKPELVDFNIHPAKKEVRFQDISALHHEVSTAVKKFFFHYTEKNIKIKNQYQLPEPQYTPSKNITYKKNILVDDFSKIIMHSNPRYTSPKHFENNHSSTKFSIDDLTDEALDIKPTDCTPLSNDESNFTFVGIIFKTFILIQKNNLLYIIDQHAAHERYIFDSIINQKGKCQKLLLPYKIETSSASDDIYLSSIQASLLDFGFELKKIKKGEWEVLSIHERWKGSKSDLENELLTSRVSPNEIIRKIAALTACRASVKAGDILDESTAIDIAKKAFSLKDPHCPHGRPVWTIITKDELFEKVKRT